MGILFSAMDFNTRMLAPYTALTKGGSYAGTVRLDLLRPLLPLALRLEFQTRNFACLATTLAAFFAAFLPIISGSLLQPTLIPIITSARLRTTTTFAVISTEDWDYLSFAASNIQASLILEANLTYPPWTYQDLAMPQLTLEDFRFPSDNASQTLFSDKSSLKINATIPALRSRLACSSFPESAITSWFILKSPDAVSAPNEARAEAEAEAEAEYILLVNITGEVCPKEAFANPHRPRDSISPFSGMEYPNTNTTFYGTTASFNTRISKSPLGGLSGFFGATASGMDVGMNRCNKGPFIYIRGHFSPVPPSESTNSGDSESIPATVAVSAMKCDPSLESVDVIASFIGGPDSELHLDPNTPPHMQPNESTVRPYPLFNIWETMWSFDLGNCDGPYTALEFQADHLHVIGGGNQNKNGAAGAETETVVAMLDPFFAQLVTSRYAIPVSALGNVSRVEEVQAAISFQHGVVLTQRLARDCRVSVGTSNTTVGAELFPTISTTNSDDGIYHAQVTDPYGKRRLVQNPVATRALQGLMCLILGLGITGWVLDGPARGKVLPRSPGSVASVVALLAGGDVLGCLLQNRGCGERWRWVGLDDVRDVFGDDRGAGWFWMGRGPSGENCEKEGRFGIWATMLEEDEKVENN
ncbi:hypothetical protein B0T19DRAFT_413193 [Cercophora scortea]|uniref:Uncharacterized protein n=1 Tax=Cercophora scortea TaxID=314031 RepID=A0AAE0MM65_9PEZI|nr:hypothetical protein B0T19DRAFT_413193 [Cercophora scortea]